MDRMPGQPVSRAGALLTELSGAERSRLATTLLGATLEQIIGDGIFHADLHAGNIFITPDGKLGLLDFGAVGRLGPATQTSLGLMLYSIDQNDSAGATDALIELLGRPDGLNDRGGGRTGRRRTPAALRRRHPCGTGSEALRRSVQSRARAPVLRAGTDQRRIPGDGLRRGCAADDRPALRRRRRVPAGGQQAREVEAQGHEDHR
ncbi:AarF/UbiB family protein [Brevibacterium iodinum]|uniref:AarF/UbiB family protein n=1 Tax=Brevibacterium iodinum TaxID=31943 RepID=UPI0023EA52D8|nr:AarF/UbiB family protein [Brevibacterium iodinum]